MQATLELPQDLLDPAAWGNLARLGERTEACARELAGVADPKEAWETLAARGWIPPEAIDDPARVFRSIPQPPAPGEEDPNATWAPATSHPPLLAFAARMGAAWGSALLAEELAHEARRRFRSWQRQGRPQPRPTTNAATPRVRWFFGEPAQGAMHDLGALVATLARRAPRAAERAEEDVRAFLRKVPPVVAARLAASLRGHRLLVGPIEQPSEARALRAMLTDPSAEGPWPDPFEPHLLAYATGGWYLDATRANPVPLDLWALPDPLALVPASASGLLRWAAFGSR